MKYTLTEDQVKEYMKLTSPEEKQKRKESDEIVRLYIKDKIRHIETIVKYSKYKKSEWLKKFNNSVGHRVANKRIDEISKNLGYVSRNLDDEQKAEVGFWLLMDYLRELHNDLLKAKSCVNSKRMYKNIDRTGEVLHLFYNPLTLKDLEEAYKKRRKYLSAVGAGLQSQLKDADEELRVTLNQDIEAHNKALKTLRGLYTMLRENWEEKVDPLVPSIDDRKVKDLPLANPILKALAVKPESNLSSLSKDKKKLVLAATK